MSQIEHDNDFLKWLCTDKEALESKLAAAQEEKDHAIILTMQAEARNAKLQAKLRKATSLLFTVTEEIKHDSHFIPSLEWIKQVNAAIGGGE